MREGSLHASHPEIVKRLKRAEGHLRKIAQMIEAGRPCLDVAQQLQAVESAVNSAKKALIRDHVDHCLQDAIEAGEGRALLSEFREISKYL